MLKLALALALGISCLAPLHSVNAADTTSSTKSDQPGTDTWVTTKVKAKLAATKGISSGDISVTTKDGVVALSGTVNSKAQMQKAKAVAKSIKGVHSVDASALSSRD